MAETDAMQKALELDRDFELRLVRWNFERLASYIRTYPERWHALKQGGRQAVLAAIGL